MSEKNAKMTQYTSHWISSPLVLVSIVSNDLNAGYTNPTIEHKTPAPTPKNINKVKIPPPPRTRYSFGTLVAACKR